MFKEPIFLIYYDLKRRLYTDIDVSKKGFGAIIYYVKKDKSVFGKEDIELIIFLSKIFTPAEIRYWSTELETARII